MTKNIHTVPQGDKWAVKIEHQDQPVSTHFTQAAAIEAGKALAKREEAEHYIHRADGTIREKNSYGNDPVNVKG